MKKNWLMLLMICAVCTFSACSDDDDNPVPQNPVTEVRVPSTAEIGTEISVPGNGFASNAQLYLKNTEGEKVKVADAGFSASGATFKIPMSLTVGEYTLVLLQDGEWDLGKITLTAASLPVLGLEIPDEGWIGKKLTIAGSGFNATAKVFFEDAAGTRTELSNPDVTNGFVAKIPATVVAGTYKLILTQDGGEWVLKDEFHVVVAPVIKRLTGVKYTTSVTITDYSPLNDFSEEELLENFGLSSVAEVQEMLEQLLAMSSGETEMELIYEGDLLKEVKKDGVTKYTFTCTDNQIIGENQDYDPEYSATVTFTLNLENGRVENNSAEYTLTRGKTYNWKYDDNGNWQGTQLSESGRDYSVYNFRDGNFVTVYDEEDVFEYNQREWKNNPNAIDVGLYLYTQTNDVEDAEVYAVLLGLCGTPSVNLPSASFLSGSRLPLVYDYDGDGYVVSASMSGSGVDPMMYLLPAEFSDEYEFIYEEVDYE